MEIVSRVSKGSNMDQVYLPKNRPGLPVGSYVVVAPVSQKIEEKNLYFYHTSALEPVKIEIINQIMETTSQEVEYDNLIVTGSFLEKGFMFRDIDILLITGKKVNKAALENKLKNKLKIKIQVIPLTFQTLLQGLSTDPLYEMMLSRFVAKKRIIYRAKRKIDYQLLDMHLHQSKTPLDNFDMLTGREKYALVRNMVAISLFAKRKKLNKNSVDKEIKKELKTNPENIKENMFGKNFLEQCKFYYKKTFEALAEGMKCKTEAK